MLAVLAALFLLALLAQPLLPLELRTGGRILRKIHRHQCLAPNTCCTLLAVLVLGQQQLQRKTQLRLRLRLRQQVRLSLAHQGACWLRSWVGRRYHRGTMAEARAVAVLLRVPLL